MTRILIVALFCNLVLSMPMQDTHMKNLKSLKIDQNMKDLFALPFEKRHEENVMDIGTQMNEFPEMYGQQVSSQSILESGCILTFIDLTPFHFDSILILFDVDIDLT